MPERVNEEWRYAEGGIRQELVQLRADNTQLRIEVAALRADLERHKSEDSAMFLGIGKEQAAQAVKSGMFGMIGSLAAVATLLIWWLLKGGKP